MTTKSSKKNYTKAVRAALWEKFNMEMTDVVLMALDERATDDEQVKILQDIHAASIAAAKQAAAEANGHECYAALEAVQEADLADLQLMGGEGWQG